MIPFELKLGAHLLGKLTTGFGVEGDDAGLGERIGAVRHQGTFLIGRWFLLEAEDVECGTDQVNDNLTIAPGDRQLRYSMLMSPQPT